ncbi:hypothetical protein [Winogradskyella vincentii]|uniref:Lipoprotein n=1 Tax=Winogradskyella vincentii TaxID=2877122 RepID=A0ABS7Y515_9FLAO|nr:hypothetical protein [Winogradskyella vincentii]MCA0154430.1 hypothetical protein [Winogradskyella vincentii]
MKTFKFLTVLFMSFLAFTSCQDEIDNDIQEDPNTNSSNSVVASNLKRSAMYDGSFDDFLDGISCSSVLLPVTATVNGTQVTLVSESDYQLVINILGQLTNDDDSVEFQFPITVQLSNYTQVVVNNASEYEELMEACEDAEDAVEDAINCLDIEFPITILTYDINAEQTGSVVLESDQELYTYMNNLDDQTFFALNYPITATVNGSSAMELTSDTELQAQINDCLATEDMEDDAEDSADDLEDILVDGLFMIESFITTGTDTANAYAEYTIDFANDLSVVAENTVNTTIDDVEGTYEVASELEVFLTLSFSNNATFELLNNTWEVTSFSESTISLQSSTNAAVTLVLSQI